MKHATASTEIGFAQKLCLPAARSMCRNPSRSLIDVPKDDLEAPVPYAKQGGSRDKQAIDRHTLYSHAASSSLAGFFPPLPHGK